MAKEEVPQHIDTGDQNAVKNLLDDELIKLLKEELNYQLNYKWDNVKLFLMFSACLISTGAHFHKTPFPQDYLIVYACVGGFFTINSLLVLMAYFIEKDSIATTIQSGKNSQFVVRTEFPRFKEHYTVSLEALGTKNLTIAQRKAASKKAKSSNSGLVQKDFYIGHFFDSEGNFNQPTFTKEISSLVASFEKLKNE